MARHLHYCRVKVANILDCFTGCPMEYDNLVQVHRLQAQRFGPRSALRYKKQGLYRDISWTSYRALVEACACALVEAGIRPGDRIGLVSENRVEWLIADMAIMAVGAINVPPHAPLTARQICFQLQETDVRWLFVSTLAQLEKIRQVLAELPGIEGVVMFDPLPASRQEDTGLRPISWDGFLQLGRLTRERHRQALSAREADLGPESLATIMYTSGTTGNPKGVMLTHGNLLANARSTNQASPRRECGAAELASLQSHLRSYR